MPSSRPLTISDVAARAGVSQASVSRVLNGKDNVAPGIVAAVRAAVDELGYRRSVAARSLVNGRNHTIAMVVPDLENPLFQGILKGLSLAASADGYRVLVADTNERVEDEAAVAQEARERCDAIVLCAPRMDAGDLAALAEKVAPAVIVNRQLDAQGIPFVGVDYARGIVDLVEHLYGLGHRKVIYLAGPVPSASNRDRLSGLDTARATHPDLEIEVIACGSRTEDGAAAAERVDAARADGVTAVLAFNDLVAVGLLTTLVSMGVDVPGRLSIAGFDDIPTASFTTPPLTSMSVPRAELGAQVWTRMKTLLADGPGEHALLYRPRLEARASTAAATAS